MPRYTPVQHPGNTGTSTTPTIGTVAPASAVINTPVQITITGTGFENDSIVKLDGNTVLSTFVSATQLKADLPGFGVPSTKNLTVTTEGKTSTVRTFAITAT